VTRYAGVVLAFVLDSCAAPPASIPIAPATLPVSTAPYEDVDRAFVAPEGGHVSQSKGDTVVDWESGAKLTVAALSWGPRAVADESIVNALRSIRTLEGRPLMREEGEGAIVLCLEGAPPTATAACTRIDAESRQGGALILTTFTAQPSVYASMGGVRVAAEAARSARGFGAGERLPPP
jgi:hypothetical protein